MPLGQKKIIFVHTKNDFGGTSLILSEIIQGVTEHEYQVEIFMGRSKTEGFLSSFVNIPIYTYPFYESKKAWLEGIYLIIFQIYLFFKLLRYARQDVAFYVNTIKPWGAGLAGWVLKKRVLYHIHEISFTPKVLDTFCRFFVKLSAHDIIFVSNFIRRKKNIDVSRKHVVHNALSPGFIAKTIPPTPKDTFTILMLCNLKVYKGVIEFVHIARRLPQYHFELVLNATDDEINAFFKKIRFSENLTVHSSQPSVHRFYARASLVVNLSHPDKWLESFGMTILEAMNYGLPVIVPPIGGISELVIDNYNGFHISYNDTDKLISTIIKIAEDPELYLRLSTGALEMVKKFSYNTMINNIISIIKTGQSLPDDSLTQQN